MSLKRVWILTLFPEYFEAFQSCGVIRKALEPGHGNDFRIELKTVNIRDFADNKYKSVDDYCYGGGPGMVIKPDILKAALEKGTGYKPESHFVIYTSARGIPWENDCAREFAKNTLSQTEKDLVFICGRYEGLDERFIQKYVDQEYSIGDFIVTGGELPVMLILDSSLRFVEGVLGNRNSYEQESFQNGLIEQPHFTRPRVFEGISVPDVLLSGHHKNIQDYQKSEQLRLTELHRPDLLGKNNE